MTASKRKAPDACAALQVVAAPTGSGKTGVMELAILRVFSSRKAVYLGPVRALVQVWTAQLPVHASAAVLVDYARVRMTLLPAQCEVSLRHDKA